MLLLLCQFILEILYLSHSLEKLGINLILKRRCPLPFFKLILFIPFRVRFLAPRSHWCLLCWLILKSTNDCLFFCDTRVFLWNIRNFEVIDGLVFNLSFRLCLLIEFGRAGISLVRLWLSAVELRRRVIIDLPICWLLVFLLVITLGVYNKLSWGFTDHALFIKHLLDQLISLFQFRWGQCWFLSLSSYWVHTCWVTTDLKLFLPSSHFNK